MNTLWYVCKIREREGGRKRQTDRQIMFYNDDDDIHVDRERDRCE